MYCFSTGNVCGNESFSILTVINYTPSEKKTNFVAIMFSKVCVRFLKIIIGDDLAVLCLLRHFTSIKYILEDL